MAVPKAEPLRIGVHLAGEGLLGPGDAFGEHHRRVIARQSDDAVQQIFDADLLVRRQEHGRAGGGAMPFLPGLGPHRAHLAERELAAVDQLEGDFGGHHLGHRRRRHARVGVLVVEHRARRQVDQIGDLRRRIELRRGGGRGAGEQDGGGGGKRKGARHERLDSPIELTGPVPIAVRSRPPEPRPKSRRNSSNCNRGSRDNWSVSRYARSPGPSGSIRLAISLSGSERPSGVTPSARHSRMVSQRLWRR